MPTFVSANAKLAGFIAYFGCRDNENNVSGHAGVANDALQQAGGKKALFKISDLDATVARFRQDGVGGVG